MDVTDDVKIKHMWRSEFCHDEATIRFVEKVMRLPAIEARTANTKLNCIFRSLDDKQHDEVFVVQGRKALKFYDLSGRYL